MTKYFLIPLTFVCLLSLTGCPSELSESVDQSKIWTAYEVLYNKNENKTYALASFRFGNGFGTVLQLSSPSEVRFNGDLLAYNNLTGLYERTYAGLIAGGTFVFKDTKGTTYTNTLASPTAIAFADAPNPIPMQRGMDYPLTWVGTALSANEDVAILLGTKLFYQINTGATSITLGGAVLNDLTAGAYIAYMDRYSISLTPAQTPSAGGITTVKYRTANKNVQLSN
jgi:hypothetical protein